MKALLSLTAVSTMAIAGCALSTGVLPVGPGIYTVVERRAQVLGGAIEAQRVALWEATSFCQQQGGVFAPETMGAGGNAYNALGPTDFSITFHCAPPVQPSK